MQDSTFVLLQKILPKKLLTLLAGKLAECRWSPLKNWLIRTFIRHYNVNMNEAVRSTPEEFVHFNDFFTRELKPDVRSFTDRSLCCLSPADGTISQMGDFKNATLPQAKGVTYRLEDLLAADTEMVSTYQNGSFATIYLSPRDYHRVHMPVDGVLQRTIYVPGHLFSVNDATTKELPNLFTMNERLICEFEHADFRFLSIMVGAMVVAGIDTVWEPAGQRDHILQSRHFTGNQVPLEMGSEMGRFYLGSTVILIFPENRIKWRPEHKAGTQIQVGQELGELLGRVLG